MELQFLDGVLVGGDVIAAEIKEVYDAEVDAADLVRIVIDKADDGLGVGSADAEFFGDFALDAVEVEGFSQAVVSLIDGVDVPANANAALCDESLLSGGSAACVAEVATVVVKDRIRDELLVRRVLLRSGTLHEKVCSWGEDRVQVTIRIRLKALEGAELIKERAGDDENVFHE